MRFYNSLEEFKVDHQRVCMAPNDQHLIVSIQTKVNNSNQTLQLKIDDYLCDFLLESNPWYVFEKVAKRNPKCIFIFKTPNDPWFLC